MQLNSGSCTIERVAQMLRIDRRTIHRRLQRQGETFSAQVDAVRRELCVRYVAERQRTLAEISSLLGFSAPSGFSRWHRRNFGTTGSGCACSVQARRDTDLDRRSPLNDATDLPY